jgi:Protein of unknown function (DUF2723)
MQGWAALGVGLVAFAAYVFATTPTPYPLDSAELATAAFGLGVAHPPGEETTLLFAKAFTLLPLGNAAFKVALSQAAAGAAAAVLVFFLVLQTLQTVALVMERTSLQARTAVAAAAALAFAFAPGVVAVSDRAEVYAVQTALSLGGLWLALQARAHRDARLAMLAALTIGLGVGNHSLVAGLVGAGAVVAAWPLLRASTTRGRFVLLAVLTFCAGLLVHAYLPLRTQALFATAARGIDNVLWGDARSLRGLWWLVSARTFAEKAAVVHGNATPWDLPFVFFEELEIVFALLAPAGLYFLVRRSSSRPAATAIAVAAAGSMLAALVGGLDPGNPDIRGYLGPAIALVAVLSASAVATGLGFLQWSKLRTLLAVLFLAGAASRFPSPSQYPGLRQAAAADDEVRSILADLPARGALFTSHFETGFLVGYQRFVEGARPDVAWAHLAFAAGPGYAERAVLAHPELAGVLAKAVQQSGELTAELDALDEKRPVRLEPSAVLPPSVRRSLRPNGELWTLARHTSAMAVAPLPSWMLAEASDDRQVKAYLAWRNYIDAVWACELGLHERATQRFANLERLVPRDERFAELRAHCP